MTWQKGKSGNPKGRGKGVKNKQTTELKQSVLIAFRNLGGIEHMTEWARENPTEFYRIASKLIPQEKEITGNLNVSYSLAEVLTGLANECTTEDSGLAEESREVRH